MKPATEPAQIKCNKTHVLSSPVLWTCPPPESHVATSRASGRKQTKHRIPVSQSQLNVDGQNHLNIETHGQNHGIFWPNVSDSANWSLTANSRSLQSWTWSRGREWARSSPYLLPRILHVFFFFLFFLNSTADQAQSRGEVRALETRLASIVLDSLGFWLLQVSCGKVYYGFTPVCWSDLVKIQYCESLSHSIIKIKVSITSLFKCFHDHLFQYWFWDTAQSSKLDLI